MGGIMTERARLIRRSGHGNRRKDTSNSKHRNRKSQCCTNSCSKNRYGLDEIAHTQHLNTFERLWVCVCKQIWRMSMYMMHEQEQEQMSSTKASSMRSGQLLRNGNLSRWILLWVTADLFLKATSTPNSKSLMYKKERKTNSSPITWHRYAKRTIGWFCPSTSRCKDLRGQLQKDQDRTLGTICTCKEM